jgi:thiol-disulfide isomerase/thioredoxin
MFKTLLTLLAFASLTIVTRSYAQSDLPPLADQVDPTPTPVPTATPAPIPLPTAAPLPGKWLTNENEAINQAAQQGKVILVDFDADWCSWCTKMHNEVLSRDRFKEFAAANLILLRMDCPMPESRRSPAAVALLNRCNVTVFPTLLLMKSDGEEIARYKGYATESVIVQWLGANVRGGEAADSIPYDQRLAKREEAANSPGGRQVDQMQAIIIAMMGGLGVASIQNTKELAEPGACTVYKQHNIWCFLYSVAFSCPWLVQLARTSQERSIMC